MARASAPELLKKIDVAAECYSNAEEFEDWRDWLDALGEEMDELCELVGRVPPDLDVMFERWGKGKEQVSGKEGQG